MKGTEHSGVNSPESWLVGARITEVPERVNAANPETYIRDNNAPPFLIQHGDKDPIVPVQHSIELAEKLRRAIGDDNVVLEVLEGAEHADGKFETPEDVQKVLDILDRWLKPN